MSRIVLVFSLVLMGFGSSAQSPLKVDPCSLTEGFIPDTQGYTPIKRVRLAIHVFAKADGSGNFRNNKEDREFIGRIINHMQWHYKDLDTLRNFGPAYRYVADSRIRFVVDTILFHYDSDAWNFRKYACYYETRTHDSTGYDLSAVRRRCGQLYDRFVQGDETLPARIKDSALNIFFLEAKYQQDKGMAENYQSKKWAYFTGAYYNYKKGRNHWTPGLLMAHEIGHALGLTHPFDYSGCDDLPLSEKGTTNDVMDTWPGEGRAMTPCQMGQIHRNLIGYGMGDIGDALIRDWCEYHWDETMYIQAGDTVRWMAPHYLWGDLVIENSATLIVKCRVSLPPGGSIKIKNKGALIVDGGELTQACGGEWQGVKMNMRKKFLGVFKRKPRAVFKVINDGAVNRVAAHHLK